MSPIAAPLPADKPLKSYRTRAVKIVVVYAVVSVLWISFSDHILTELVDDRVVLENLSVLKGWLFVLGTSLMLLVLFNHSFKQLAEHIGARVNAEQAARERDAQLRALGDNLPDSYVYRYEPTPLGPRFHHVSAGVERVHGIPLATLLRDPAELYRQIHPDHRALLPVLEDKSRRTMTDFDLEVTFQRGDGGWRWLSLRSHPQKTETGEVVWDGVATDITERKQVETDLRLCGRSFSRRFRATRRRSR